MKISGISHLFLSWCCYEKIKSEMFCRLAFFRPLNSVETPERGAAAHFHREDASLSTWQDEIRASCEPTTNSHQRGALKIRAGSRSPP